MSIEDIILGHDQRGISALRPHLPEDFCDQAAKLVLDHPGTAMIATGFYIAAADAAETDGPPGAIAIGAALQSVGYEVVYVTDVYAESLMTAAVGSQASVVDFPIADLQASEKFAGELLSRFNPSVMISIERCGPTQDGAYVNMRERDISSHTAMVDRLFTAHPNTVGIGDGGNEIGMGNLASVVPTVPSLVRVPCATTTTKLVISSVSNWGGYGLVAAISRRAGKDLLLSAEREEELVRSMVGMGAVDGTTGLSDYKVDGFSLEENGRVITELHNLLADESISR